MIDGGSIDRSKSYSDMMDSLKYDPYDLINSSIHHNMMEKMAI